MCVFCTLNNLLTFYYCTEYLTSNERDLENCSKCKIYHKTKSKGESHFSVLPLPLPLPLHLTPSPCPSNPYEMRHHLVTVTSSYIVSSWLLRHQRRQVLITNFQDAVCKCVCVDRVGFSDVFAIVCNKLAIFLKVSIKNMVANIYVQDCVEHKTKLS